MTWFLFSSLKKICLSEFIPAYKYLVYVCVCMCNFTFEWQYIYMYVMCVYFKVIVGVRPHIFTIFLPNFYWTGLWIWPPLQHTSLFLEWNYEERYFSLRVVWKVNQLKSLEKSLTHGICPANINHYTVISHSILKCCLFPFSLSTKFLEHPYKVYLFLVLFNSTFCRAWGIWDFWFFCSLMLTYMFRHMNLWN